MLPDSFEFSLKRIEPTSYVFSKDKRLGKGAYGEVYFGFDQKKKIPIAVKTISFEKIMQSNTSLESFFQKLVGQMANMQLCKSKHLVQLISPHKSSKNMYLVCEYCNGGSLKDFLSRYGPLSEYETIYFFKEILQGIKSLHEKKVVHRDLKPANILMHDYELKIGDLGFSKSLEVHSQILTSIVGTPLYMSPQILSQKHYTQKSDVWSLGVMLFEMLCGEAPWRVNSIPQILQKAKNTPDFNKIPYCSSNLKELLYRMLQYEQKNRISLNELFITFFNSEQDMLKQQMQEETNNINLEKCLAQVKKCEDYFTFSLELHSEQKIRRILSMNNIPHLPLVNYSLCLNARQCISQAVASERAEDYVSEFFQYYRGMRNKLAYLINIFFRCYDIITKSENLENRWTKGIGTFGSMHALMIIIVRYSLEQNYEFLDQLDDNIQKNYEIKTRNHFNDFKNRSISTNLKSIFQLDIQYLKRMFPDLYTHILLPRITALPFNNSVNKDVKKNISSFLTEILPSYCCESQSQMEEEGVQEEVREGDRDRESGRDSLEFLEFWLKHYLYSLYNDLVAYILNHADESRILSTQNTGKRVPEQQCYLKEGLTLTKMIYQFYLNEKTQLFQGLGRNINIYRKIQNWTSEVTIRKWYNKIKQQQIYLRVQHINSFLDKKIKASQLAMYHIGFL